jgi:hypothetical protein
MGWASFFEDVLRRGLDNQADEGTVPLGPAGSPLKQIRSHLDASLQRLQFSFDKITNLVEQNFRKGEWRDIAEMVDDATEESEQFNRTTVLASKTFVTRTAAQITSKLEAAMNKARTIQRRLEANMAIVDVEVKYLRRNLLKSDALLLSAGQTNLIVSARKTLEEWQGLLDKLESLESQERAVQITLTDCVFPRLFQNGNVIDKDESHGSA